MAQESLSDIKTEYLKLHSALIENICTEIDVNDMQYVSFKKKPNTRPLIKSFPKKEIPQSVSVDYSSRANVLTPNRLVRQINECAKCGCVNAEKYSGSRFKDGPQAIVVSDFRLDEDNRKYLDKILSSIGISSEDDCYFTALVKCCGDEKASAENCFSYLQTQISLFAPRSILVFGKKSTEKLSPYCSGRIYCNTTPIIMNDYLPLDIKEDLPAKKKLWAELKGLADYLSLL